MKDAIEFLKKLPEPYRSQAIENYEKETSLGYIKERKTCSNISNSIICGFSWKKSNQGAEYWCDIHDISLNGEFDQYMKFEESDPTTIEIDFVTEYFSIPKNDLLSKYHEWKSKT